MTIETTPFIDGILLGGTASVVIAFVAWIAYDIAKQRKAKLKREMKEIAREKAQREIERHMKRWHDD